MQVTFLEQSTNSYFDAYNAIIFTFSRSCPLFAQNVLLVLPIFSSKSAVAIATITTFHIFFWTSSRKVNDWGLLFSSFFCKKLVKSNGMSNFESIRKFYLLLGKTIFLLTGKKPASKHQDFRVYGYLTKTSNRLVWAVVISKNMRIAL